MITVRTSSLVASLFVVLPTYAAAQTLPTAPPSGYYNTVASNPKGTVTNFTYGSDYPARVYTPPGYSKSQAYPTMYLMHGMGGSERSWHDNDLYAHIQLDNLLAEGKVAPFIIVFTRNDMNNWGFGPILLQQLMPYIEENYCVSTDPNNRALGGLSMGGMLTINIGFPNPDKFHYLMPSSPAPGIQGESQLFPSSLATAQQAMRLLFFTCGSGEVGSYGCNNANTVRDQAKNHGLESIVKEWIAQGGAHNAATWRPSFWNFAQLADQAGFTNVGTGRSAGCTGGGAGGTTGGTGGRSGGTGGTSGGAGGTSGGTGGTSGGTGGANGGTSGGGGTGTGGRVAGTGGAGTGGTRATGSGGTTATGAGGTAIATGGTIRTGTGGTGAGGTMATGAGGTVVGSGGSIATGSGGAPAGSGGVAASGGTVGSGGSSSSGGGGTSVDEADAAAGCACALASARSRSAASEEVSLFFFLAIAVAVLVLRSGRTRRRRKVRG